MAQKALEPAVEARRVPMTYDEWLAWPEAESRQSEWANGEAIVFMPPQTPHMLLGGFFYRILSDFVDIFNLGRVGYAPFEVRFSTTSREPDVFFVKNEHLWRWEVGRIVGPVDLAIEIVSPDNVTRDRHEKFREYAAGGIPEYWLLDPRPRKQRADFYALGADGAYVPVALDGGGRFHSRVLPGFWLDPAWLWQDPLPKVAEVLRRIVPDGG